MENWQALLIFLIVRIASVFFVQTWYVPDEYWQSLEVAHKFIFGYGELTWEWKLGIRSYIYPLLISFLYKILHFTKLDYVNLLVFLPRMLQALLSAYADYRFYRWSGHKKWSVFIIASSFFWFYTGSRTLINSFETALTMIALSYFPWPDKHNDDINKFIWTLGIACAIRPTAAIPWLPLCLYHIKTSKESLFRLLVSRYLPIGITIFVGTIMIDSYIHGSFLVSSYEFLKLNFVQGIGAIYGSHPWHWYLSNGIPTILGVNFVPFMLAAYFTLKHRFIFPNELVLLSSMVFTTAVYSYFSHKEFRFILPILPMALHIISNYLSRWSSKVDIIYVWIVAGVILTGNLVPAYYISYVHQRGSLDVMTDVHEIASQHPKNTSFLFLMPCHSTPLYSHIHINVPLRYLTCLPNLSNKENYKDEADLFYDSPAIWLRSHYPPIGKMPSHIIIFDVLQAFITDILSRYRPIKHIFHTNIVTDARAGQNIIIYEFVKMNNTIIVEP